jgi:ferrochelatase
MAYGGPDSLSDVPLFLSNVRGGRPVPPQVVDRYVERYRLIGGYSPLLTITQRVSEALGRELILPVYLAMRHWSPTIESVVARMADDGVERALGICLVPHYSDLSVGAYGEQVQRAVAATSGSIQVEMLDNWHLQIDYLAGLVGNISRALSRFSQADRGEVQVVFSAHSLPAAILERGDPYPDQLLETAEHLAKRLSLPSWRWTLAYQSASRGTVPWLGPSLEEVVADLAAAGRHAILVAPIGFLVDNLELLYDIDIDLQAISTALGLRLERMPSLNDSPALVNALASLVQDHLPLIERTL